MADPLVELMEANARQYAAWVEENLALDRAVANNQFGEQVAVIGKQARKDLGGDDEPDDRNS